MTIASVLTVVTFVTRSGHRSVLTHRHAQEFCRWDQPSGMSLFQPTAVGTHWVHTKPRCEVDRDLPYRSSWDNGKEISSFLCWSHQFGPRRLKDRHDWLADRENRTGTSTRLIKRPDRAHRSWTIQRSIRVEYEKVHPLIVPL